MADEYGLRKDIDELYDLVYDNESNQFRLVTKEELAESNNNIELNHYTKIEVDDLIDDIISGQIDLTNYIKKSNTTGLIKNDGSIDTNTYITSANINSKEDVSNKASTFTSKTDDTHYPTTKLVKDNLDDKISKSNTTGLIKNDGSVDTSSYVVQESGKGLFSGNYNDLTNKPTIPSAYTHPSTKQCNYSYTHPSSKQCDYSYTHPSAKQCNYSYTHPSAKQCDASIPSSSSDLSDGSSLIKVTAVTPTSSTDIDTYTTIGFYTFFNNTAVASMTSENKAKLPTGLGEKSFYLVVESKSDYIKQTLTKYSDGRTWIRIRNDDNGVDDWGNWRELEVVGHTHTTSDITNFPTIPSKTSDLSNDSNFISTSNTTGLIKNDGTIDTSSYLTTGTASSTYVAKETGKGLFSGSYNDLTNKPTLFSGSYNDLTDKPTLFSGSYTDLTDKPTLFSGSYDDLTDKPSIPSDVSDLTDTNNLYQTTLVSGTSIKTINNTSLLGSGNITIEGGGGSVIGTGSFSIDNNGHLIVELPSGVDNPYFINNNGHLIYDTSNTYNGD